MSRSKTAFASLAVLFVLTGCASNQEEATERDRQMNALAEEKEALANQLANTRATRELLEKQLDGRDAEVSTLREQYEAARREEARLREELERQRETPVAVKTPSGPDIRIDNPNVEVETRDGTVVLRVSDAVTFTPGEATLTKQGMSVLADVAKSLRENPDYMISVEGHTDDTPLQKTKERWKTNMNLSIARAQAVRNYLAQVGSISESRMRIAGYGETRPLATGTSKEARSRNRRVEVVLYRPR